MRGKRRAAVGGQPQRQSNSIDTIVSITSQHNGIANERSG
jgi:hypothetical protein